MNQVFLQLLNMSLSAGWIVLAVVLLRLALKKAPKWLHCALWSLVALRLLLPVFPESPFSLLPSARVVPADIAVSAAPAIHTGFTAVNAAVNPVLTKTPANELETLIAVLTAVWAFGVVQMLFYGAASYLRLRKRVAASVDTGSRIYISDYVDTPFILGFFRPRIYLPSDLTGEQTVHVLAHERAHLHRRDHWWKPIGFVLLALHWFNPLLWLGYILLCRDIEKACDEKVIRDMGGAAKKQYSEALLSCSLHRRNILACPLAFGEVAVKERIKGVLNYKKPVFWVVMAAVVISVVISGCVLTDPLPCAHSYQGQITLAETCTAPGSQLFTCSQCWDSYQQAVAQHPHTYQESWVSKEATCSQTGEKSARCSECEGVFVVEALPKNDVHSMENTQLKAPTCTSRGEGLNTCRDCGLQESCTYELAEHDFKYGVTVSGSCVLPQRTQQICRKCGLYQWADTGPTTGEHRWGPDFDNNKVRCMDCGKDSGRDMQVTLPIGNSNSRNPDITDMTKTTGKSYSTVPQMPVIQWDVRPNPVPQLPGPPSNFDPFYSR